MGLLGEPVNNRVGSKCSIGRILSELDPDDRTRLLGWLDDSSYQHSAIEQSLKDAGLNPGKGAVANHRNGRCRCGDT